jgi:hypothetical protein
VWTNETRVLQHRRMTLVCRFEDGNMSDATMAMVDANAGEEFRNCDERRESFDRLSCSSHAVNRNFRRITMRLSQ